MGKEKFLWDGHEYKIMGTGYEWQNIYGKRMGTRNKLMGMV